MTRVLVVEDDEDIASVLCRGLRADGFLPESTADATHALSLLTGGGFGAAIIDRMLGDGDGIDLLRNLRSHGIDIPVIMLSALSRVEERAEGLAQGADDYVVKPFELSELLARLRVQQARFKAEPADALRFAALTFQPSLRRVTAPGREVTLTERESDLLAYLIHNAGRVLTRAQIFVDLWAGHGSAAENVVDVYLGYLRRKLAPVEDFGIALRTLRGRGFILEVLS